MERPGVMDYQLSVAVLVDVTGTGRLAGVGMATDTMD